MKQRFKNQFHVYPRIIDWDDFRTFWAGIGTAVADVVGMLLFPKAGYFPGFTLNAFWLVLFMVISIIRKK